LKVVRWRYNNCPIVQRKNGGTSHPDKLLKEIKSFNNWLDNCPVKTTTFSTRCHQRVLISVISFPFISHSYLGQSSTPVIFFLYYFGSC